MTKLLEVRKKLGLTQAELAQLIGITPTYISVIERGERPMSRSIERALDILLAKSQSGEAPAYGGTINARNIAYHGQIREAPIINPMQSLDEPPQWAKKMMDDIASLNTLLVKILSKMG